MTQDTQNEYWFDIDADITSSDMEFCRDISMRFADSAFILTHDLPSFRNFFFKQAPIDYSEHPLFKAIANVLVYTKRHGDYKHVYSRSHVTRISGSLRPHVDRRSCVITIPVQDATHPIHWYDDEVHCNMVATYRYKGMVLINTHTVHGCPENDRDRILFQIGGFGLDEPFPVVRDAISRRMSEIMGDRV